MKICFFGDITCAIKGQTIGGGELQVFLLAKSLALHGHEVFIIDPYADEALKTPEGINVITVPNWNKGVKGLRMFLYRIPALFKTFALVNADYYYVRMRSYLHLIPYLVAKRKGRKFIQAIASDIDVLNAKEKFKYLYKSNFHLLRFLTESIPNDLAFNFLVRNSDHVILQHIGQKFVSKSLNQVVFSNIIDLNNLPVNNNPSKDYFIYVGSLTMIKGADKLLTLINSIDLSIKVLIVGSPKGFEPTTIYEKLGKKENVILKGRKSHAETLELISNAKAIINTSYHEGFPNIYLEAWAMGVPVISLSVNPGDIFNHNRLGVCCNGNLQRMQLCMQSDEIDSFKKDELKAYVQKFHDLGSAADRFLKAITS